ncbi:glycosyltransferase family A protein [Geomicrobium sp. JCM 19037]|uniref:glycosyltransferase family 2 protein n=1 Tax=Geomicrobium sp. JCM 19037 TaxID=1460634 RepID=UPI000693B192|nr:glycosyltransferase family A protein [Geomicrobium sp. JCM 19037]
MSYTIIPNPMELITSPSTMEKQYIVLIPTFERLIHNNIDSLIDRMGDHDVLVMQTASTQQQWPLVIRTELFLTHPLPTIDELPFEDALLAKWLCRIPTSSVKRTADRLTRTSTQFNTTEQKIKQSILTKFTPPKIKPLPTVGVMLSVLNAERWIRNALSSIADQTVRADHVFVVDDGSTDNTVREILNMTERFPSFTLLRIPTNIGKARALNELLHYVECTWLIELDGDDWLDADAIESTKEIGQQLPERTGAFYGNLRYWKGEDMMSYKRHVKGFPVHSPNELLGYPLPLGPRVYRTTSLLSLGGYPVIDFEQGRLYEDISLLKKFLAADSLHYVDCTFYNVRQHKQSITKRNHSKWNDFKDYL